MKFGYFDDDRKEYVITSPDTPRSWINYLGDTGYGAVITNNAGGYSFYRSAGQGRILRFRFNSIPADQPGRYIYLRDRATGDYWTTSWQPVAKPLEQYRSKVRFGTGYAVFESEYKKVKSEVTYFVPLNQTYEIWQIKLTNTGKKRRELSLFTYVEYPGNWNAMDDLMNLQYTQYTLQMDYVDGIIDHGTNVLIPEMPERFEEKDQGRHTFLALAGAPVSGYDTDREVFLGPYRTYADPLVVEQGKCTGSLAYGDNGCGVLQADLSLAAGEEKMLTVIAGIGKAEETGRSVRGKYQSPGRSEKDLADLREHWHHRLSAFSAVTPDPAFNSMINMWYPYNSLITFSWARAASLVYTADERDGLGFRDAMQDLMGVIHNIPEEAEKRLELLLTGQVSSGGALPVVIPVSHHPGKEQPPSVEEYRADDCLWMFNVIPAFVKETGKKEFYLKVLPYADTGEDTVLGHMKRAIRFNLEHTGRHGLPSGLKADWNDCLRLGVKGESLFVAFQLRLALLTYADVCSSLDLAEEERWGRETLEELDALLDEYAWDGAWFLRAYGPAGEKYGSRENGEGTLYLNPQSWSILSGYAGGERALKAMEAVAGRLVSPFGIQLCDPPYRHADHTVILAQLMNPGTKENAGIFQHTQGWAVMAECMLGHGDRAYEYLKAYMPAAYNDRAEEREVEPYVLAQSTHSKYSPHYGASRIPWLTGAAAWTYHAATQYVLGIKPETDGLVIDPVIPAGWERFRVTRLFRDKWLDIYVENPDHVQSGVEKILLNDMKIEGNKIPLEAMKKQNVVKVLMG